MKKLLVIAFLALGGVMLAAPAAHADWWVRVGPRPAARVYVGGTYYYPPVRYVEVVPATLAPPPPVVVVPAPPPVVVTRSVVTVVPSFSFGFGYWHGHHWRR